VIDVPRVGELRVEYVSLSDVQRWPRNPKAHDAAAINGSIRRFGFLDPMLRDENTGRIVEGHGRLDELERLRAAGAKPPKFVKVRAEDGAWLVPIIFGVSFKTEQEAGAYLLAHNKTTEKGGWDDVVLRDFMRDLDDQGGLADGVPGFSEEDLDALLDRKSTGGGGGAGVEQGGAGAEKPDGDDAVPEAPEEPVTHPGDLWLLGTHRLLCGDSMKSEDVDRLLEKRRPAVVVTDPPFAIYGSSTGIGADIADDKMVRPFFEQLCRGLVRVLPFFAHVYIHTDWRSWAALADSARRAGLSLKNCLVWDKGSAGLGSNYSNAHEFVGFFAKLHPPKAMASGAPKGQRVVHKANILRHPRVMGDEREHNAAKPVKLEAELIENSSDPGAVVLDLFGGSGSTLIAAERTGRAACLMEIEPKWCDVIVRRWERVTGRKATRQEAGNG
jgi:DNA modification methylase